MRKAKARISKLFYRRFFGPPMWRSQEDRAWDNIAPVGAEFGSPDFDRIENERHMATLKKLRLLSGELRESVVNTQKSVRCNLDQTDRILSELREGRAKQSTNDPKS
ncbi:MAG: hypothetical protein ABIQ90_02085 [Polaromonas sp.]